jgi:hypothetical protein
MEDEGTVLAEGERDDVTVRVSVVESEGEGVAVGLKVLLAEGVDRVFVELTDGEAVMEPDPDTVLLPHAELLTELEAVADPAPVPELLGGGLLVAEAERDAAAEEVGLAERVPDTDTEPVLLREGAIVREEDVVAVDDWL